MQMKKLPENYKVSIITVNYNQAALTEKLLYSLRACNYDHLEIFVVDNASQEDASCLQELFPEIIFIRSEINLGFAGGNNLALERSTGDAVLLINNDTEVRPGFLEPLVETLLMRPDIGIVSPKIIFYDSDNLIQYAGTSAINTFTCRGTTRGYLEKADGNYNTVEETGLCHGACMLIRREVITAIGLLDPSYFLFYEEYDYCERAKRAGFLMYYNGTSSILHKQSMSVGKNTPLKAFYMSRNRIYFARRNFHLPARISSLLFYYAIALPKNVLSEWLKGRPENSRALLRGAFHPDAGTASAK